MGEIVPSVLLVAVGMFTVGGAVADWEWFMTSRRARGFVALFGRTGARLFYALLGLTIAGLGVASLVPH